MDTKSRKEMPGERGSPGKRHSHGERRKNHKERFFSTGKKQRIPAKVLWKSEKRLGKPPPAGKRGEG